MKRLNITLLLTLLFAGNTMAAENMDHVLRILATNQVELVQRYLKENPKPDDEIKALDYLISGLQLINRTREMEAPLRRRYECLVEQQKWERSLLEQNVLPILVINYKLMRFDVVDGFTSVVREDLADTPLAEQAERLFAELENQYRIPDVGDRLAVQFTEFFSGAAMDTGSMTGKYVLIEFWMTTCELCKTQKEYLREVYDTYHDQGLEVISFSEDVSRTALEKYLANDPLPWIMSYDPDNSVKVISQINLRAVPYNFLIDPTGKIIATDLRGVALVEKIRTLFPE